VEKLRENFRMASSRAGSEYRGCHPFTCVAAPRIISDDIEDVATVCRERQERHPAVWFNPQENAIEKIPLACNQSRSPTEGTGGNICPVSIFLTISLFFIINPIFLFLELLANESQSYLFLNLDRPVFSFSFYVFSKCSSVSRNG